VAFEQRHRGHCYICADCNYLDLMPTRLCYSTAGPVGSKAKAHAKRCHEIMLRHGFMERAVTIASICNITDMTICGSSCRSVRHLLK
jgi:hypothetical protein